MLPYRKVVKEQISKKQFSKDIKLIEEFIMLDSVIEIKKLISNFIRWENIEFNNAQYHCIDHKSIRRESKTKQR